MVILFKRKNYIFYMLNIYWMHIFQESLFWNTKIITKIVYQMPSCCLEVRLKFSFCPGGFYSPPREKDALYRKTANLPDPEQKTKLWSGQFSKSLWTLLFHLQNKRARMQCLPNSVQFKLSVILLEEEF